MKKLTLIFAIILLISCDELATESHSDIELQKNTEIALQESNRELGMPAIINFQEKKNLKWIYELCDKENLVCHAYLFNEMQGTIGQYLGECIGYGTPYSTQYSNPDKIVDADDYGVNNYHSENDVVVISQAEPNGLFKPTGLSATWLIMIDPKTKEPRPVYVEPLIIVSPFKF